MPELRRQMQRGVAAIVIRLDVSAGEEQPGKDVGVPGSSSRQQRVDTVFIHRHLAGAGVQQHGNAFGVPLPRRPDESGGAAPVLGVHDGAGGEQRADNARVPGARSADERRGAVLIGSVDARTGGQQRVHFGGLPFGGGAQEGCCFFFKRDDGVHGHSPCEKVAAILGASAARAGAVCIHLSPIHQRRCCCAWQGWLLGYQSIAGNIRRQP